MTTRRVLAAAALVGAAAIATIAQAPQGPQSQGALQQRPGADRTPEFPVPNIREYKPHSTLVVPQHPVPRAKFPVIDIHSHQPAPISEQQFETLVKSMDPLNLQLLVNASGVSGDRLVQSIAALKASRYKNRMVQFATINWGQTITPGFGERAARQLEADAKAGALGVGEIMKNFGLRVKKSDGSRLKLDDPELDPIWQTAARLNIPIFIHTADPQEFFQPINLTNERWLELALYPDRRYPSSQFPTWEELNGERDRLFKRNPKTTFITAHMGWHANDLARLGKMFDEMPNLYTEVGAILYDLGRQPRAAHDFFIKYQDRILFGKDSYQPDEFPYYWRVFETNDEYFDYYRDYHAFWKLYGLGLPDQVLRKLYYQNALKLFPGLPRAGFPQ
ncbi:MAG TPA: amidohydrolase family protein [Vicinamibacterales bacterium]|nr:amidohydrolase family protein [Vicinamibacterales bacterium]